MAHSVQAGERLDCLRFSQPFINIHCHEFRLVKSRLVFIRYQQHLIAATVEFIAQFFRRDSFSIIPWIHLGFCIFLPVQGYFSRESYQSTDSGVSLLFNIGVKRKSVLNSRFTRGSNDHCFCVAVQKTCDICPEVFNNDFNFLGNVSGMKVDKTSHFSFCGNRMQFRVILDCFVNVAVCLPCHIVVQNIQDIPFLYCLPHGIQIERAFSPICFQGSKKLESIPFRGCSKRNHGNVLLFTTFANLLKHFIFFRF